MKLDIRGNKVTVRCIRCGCTFSLTPEAYVKGSLPVKTTCPKCRGVMKGRRKKR